MVLDEIMNEHLNVESNEALMPQLALMPLGNDYSMDQGFTNHRFEGIFGMQEAGLPSSLLPFLFSDDDDREDEDDMDDDGYGGPIGGDEYGDDDFDDFDDDYGEDEDEFDDYDEDDSNYGEDDLPNDVYDDD